MKIANKINLSFSIVVVILVGVSLFTFYEIAKTNLEKAIYAHLSTTAQSRAHHIETFLEEDKARMELLAESGLIEDTVKEIIHNGLNSKESSKDLSLILKDFVKAEKEAYELLILNPDGKVIASTDKTGIGTDKSSDAYFLAGKVETYIKDAYYSETTREETYAISTPVRDDNTKELLGVLVGRFKMTQLNETTTDRTGLGETGELYIVNKHGYMITPSRFSEDTFLKQKVDTVNLRRSILSHPETHVKHEEVDIFPDYRGVTVLGAHRYIPEMQWSLLAEIDEKEALAPLAVMRLILIIMFCAVPAVVWTVGSLLSRVITAPIHKLHRGTEIIGGGNLDYKVGTDTKDEIGQLSRAFDKMTGDLKGSTTSIDSLNAANQQLQASEQQLQAANQQLQAGNQQLQATEQQLRANNEQLQAKREELLQLNHNLGERVKELACMYSLVNSIQEHETIQEILQDVVTLIPPSWHYPEITRVRICFGDNEYVAEPFEQTQWKQTSNILIGGERHGSVEVYYTEQRPVLDEGPFLKEERDLIDSIARTLSEAAEHKQAEEATKLAYEKLEKANKELKETQSQLVQNEKLASIGLLAAGIAHEINTPVGFVASNFQTLETYIDKIEELLKMYDKLIVEIEASGKTKLLNQTHAIAKSRDDMKMDFVLEDIQELFADSKEGIGRVTNIVQNLRDFSRVDQPGSLDEYDINDGIKATLIVAKNEVKYDANVKTDFSEVPSISCHAGQINQVLLNILINAAQAIKSRHGDNMGAITIKTYATDDQVVCEIADNGCGIAPENLSKVFDPFFTTKPAGKGTGLGLSVSYDIIVNKHNGEILADSTVGEGSKFTIKLPFGRENPSDDKEEITSNGKKNSIVCG